MDVTAVSTLISNMGFPIACVCAMFFMWNKERESHKEESDKWVQAINNNTQVMKELLAKIDK